MKARPILLCLLFGLAITALTLLVAYPCCLNGHARGLPFSVWIPRCEATGLSLTLNRVGNGIHVLDLARGGANVLLWSGLALGVQSRLRRRAAPTNPWEDAAAGPGCVAAVEARDP